MIIFCIEIILRFNWCIVCCDVILSFLYNNINGYILLCDFYNILLGDNYINLIEIYCIVIECGIYWLMIEIVYVVWFMFEYVL